MSFTRKVLQEGIGDRPKKKHTVKLIYIGYLYDKSKQDNDYRGKKCGKCKFNHPTQRADVHRFDASEDHGGEEWETEIGVGKVIKGTCFT